MDERKTLRVVTDLQTEARICGNSVVLLLYNLSQGGCMVEMPGACLQIGDDIHLKLCGFEHGGTVVWEQGGIRRSELLPRLGSRGRHLPWIQARHSCLQ